MTARDVQLEALHRACNRMRRLHGTPRSCCKPVATCTCDLATDIHLLEELQVDLKLPEQEDIVEVMQKFQRNFGQVVDRGVERIVDAINRCR